MCASSRSEGAPLVGILIIHKAAGWTSHDVVARARRLLGIKRVGHAGTLDPAATGVLPLCLGQATRVVEYLSASGKSYHATIVFGVETDTFDTEGAVTATQSVPPTLDRAAIQAALPAFTGEIQQAPPRFSALKRDGQRLYDLARRGVAFEVPPRPVRIDALTIRDWQPPTLTLDVECGKGTYIRSLAHDLGAALGPGAHLAGLVRTRVGPFTLRDAISLPDLEAAIAAGTLSDHLYAADTALETLDAAILGPEHAARLGHGLVLALPTPPDDPATTLRAYATDGCFLGILERRAATWQPAKVFAAALQDNAAALQDNADAPEV